MSINFKTYNLDAICKLQMGKTPQREKSEYWGEGFPWVSIADMKGKEIDVTKEQITKKAIEECGCKKIPKGTLLLSFKLSIGKLGFAGTDLFTNEAIVALLIRDYKQIFPEYLYYILKTIPLVGKNKAAKGVTLNTESLKKIQVPLPENLEDQIRIANVLKRVDIIIGDRQASIRQIDEYLKSVFEKIFGNPVGNEKKWKIESFNSCLLDILAGTSSTNKISKEDLSSKPAKILKISAVTSGVFDPYEYKNIVSSQLGNKLLIAQEGNLLFSRANTRELVGATCIVDKHYPDLYLPDKIWILRTNKRVNTFYVHYLFQNASFRKSITGLATGTSGSMLNISMKKLRAKKIPLPPIKLQKKFASIVKKTKSLRYDYLNSLEKLENLYISLNQQLFQGKINLNKINVSDELQLQLELSDVMIKRAEEISKEAESKHKPKTTKVDKFTVLNYYEEEFAVKIKKYFGEFDFKFQEIEEMFAQEGGIVTYFTTQELKEIRDKPLSDIRNFIFDCVEKKNKHLKLNQKFYDAFSDLNFKKIKLKAGNDFMLQQIDSKQISREDLSGIYFQIEK